MNVRLISNEFSYVLLNDASARAPEEMDYKNWSEHSLLIVFRNARGRTRFLKEKSSSAFFIVKRIFILGGLLWQKLSRIWLSFFCSSIYMHIYVRTYVRWIKSKSYGIHIHMKELKSRTNVSIMNDFTLCIIILQLYLIWAMPSNFKLHTYRVMKKCQKKSDRIDYMDIKSSLESDTGSLPRLHRKISDESVRANESSHSFQTGCLFEGRDRDDTE